MRQSQLIKIIYRNHGTYSSLVEVLEVTPVIVALTAISVPIASWETD